MWVSTSIIDPYLSKVLKATDVEKDAEFISLLKALKVRRIFRNLEMGSTPDVLVAQRTKLIERAKAMGPITDATLVYGNFSRLKRRDLTLSLLGTVFPHTRGLWKKNDKTIFFIGPKDDVLAVSERLASVGIPQTHSKVKDKEEYCLMIDTKSYFGMKRVYDTIKAMV